MRVLARSACCGLLSQQLSDAAPSNRRWLRLSDGRIIFGWSDSLPLRYLSARVVLVPGGPLLLAQSELLLLLHLLGYFVLIVEGVVESSATHLVTLCHSHGVIVFGGPRRVDDAIIPSCIYIIDVDTSSDRSSSCESGCRRWSFGRKCATLTHGTGSAGWIWGLDGDLLVAGDLKHFLDDEIFLLSTAKVCRACVTPTSAVIGSSLKIVLKVSGPIYHHLSKIPNSKTYSLESAGSL